MVRTTTSHQEFGNEVRRRRQRLAAVQHTGYARTRDSTHRRWARKIMRRRSQGLSQRCWDVVIFGEAFAPTHRERCSGIVSKALDGATQSAFKEMKRVIKFVLDTKTKGLKLEPVFGHQWFMEMFSDSEYGGGDKDTRISVGGFILFLLNVPILWR